MICPLGTEHDIKSIFNALDVPDLAGIFVCHTATD
jgi:hypothetical protein